MRHGHKTSGAWVVFFVIVSLVTGACSPSPNPDAESSPTTSVAADSTTPLATTTTTASPSTSVATDDLTAVVGVSVFDGRELIPEATVVFSPDGIVSVGGDVAPDGATVVDGTGKTLLPGLIDAHQHVWSQADLRRNVVFGVTTALDMFTSPGFARAMQNEQTQGDATDRADMFSAGFLATAPDGHGTQYGLGVPTLTKPEQAQQWVADRVKEGSDYIKIVIEPGFGEEPLPTLDAATVTALVEAAHEHDLLAVVHVSDLASARVALDAGADGLVHVWVGADDPGGWITEAKQAGMFVVPTLSVMDWRERTISERLAEDPHLSPWLLPRERTALGRQRAVSDREILQAMANVRALHGADIPVLAGTDPPNIGVIYGPSLHGELELLVRAGMTPTEALAAATSAPAMAFRLDDRGIIEPGRKADLLLVDGDPTTDITATRRIDTIWKDGVRLEREAPPDLFDPAGSD